MRMRPCNGCGCDIRLLITAAGKFMPIDAFPITAAEAEGKTVVTTSGVVIRNATRERLSLLQEQIYLPHWQSCPAADRFRRRA